MATSSGLYLQTFADLLNGVAGAFDYTSTIKGAMLDSTSPSTPDFNQTTPAWADLSGNEVVSAGYTAGGNTIDSSITTKEIVVGTRATGVLDIKGTCPAWSGTTIDADALVIYDDAATADTDQMLCMVDFGGTVTSTSGTFTVTLDANGYVQMDLVP